MTTSITLCSRATGPRRLVIRSLWLWVPGCLQYLIWIHTRTSMCILSHWLHHMRPYSVLLCFIAVIMLCLPRISLAAHPSIPQLTCPLFFVEIHPTAPPPFAFRRSPPTFGHAGLPQASAQVVTTDLAPGDRPTAETASWLVPWRHEFSHGHPSGEHRTCRCHLGQWHP